MSDRETLTEKLRDGEITAQEFVDEAKRQAAEAQMTGERGGVKHEGATVEKKYTPEEAALVEKLENERLGFQPEGDTHA